MEGQVKLYEASSFAAIELPHECSTPNVDVHHEVVPVLQIAMVRTLWNYAHQPPVQERNRWIVIWAQTYTNPAQNALLKLLEEPPEYTKIIVAVPSAKQFLPTVRSRLINLEAATNKPDQRESHSHDVAIAWLNTTVADRLEQIGNLHKQSDSTNLRNLLRGVTQLAAHKAELRTPLNQNLLNDAVLYSNYPGASTKYLLEALALTLPIMPSKAEVIH